MPRKMPRPYPLRTLQKWPSNRWIRLLTEASYTPPAYRVSMSVKLLLLLVGIGFYIGMVLLGRLLIQKPGRISPETLSSIATPTGANFYTLLLVGSILIYHTTHKVGVLAYKIGQAFLPKPRSK